MSIDNALVTKRLFVGISIPASCHPALNENTSILEIQGRGNRTRTENFHCTLSFIGQTEHQTQIEGLLAQIRATHFNLEFNEPSCFVQFRRYVVYQSVQRNEGLLRLQEQVEHQLLPFLPKVEPVYTPHVTLLRNYRAQIPGMSVEQLLQQSAEPFALPPSFPVESFHLYESIQIDGILRYIRLRDFPLT